MSVVFLNRTRRQGAKGVIGPVTLIQYNITPEGTPVSGFDAEALLAMTEEPCCGDTLPFGGQVKTFGEHTPTAEQLELVPDFLWMAEPVVKVEKKKPGRRKAKVYEKPEPEEVIEPFMFDFQEEVKEEEEKEETSEEVIEDGNIL